MKRRKGFTLIELMVVVAIIGVLAAVVTPQITTSVYKARVSATAASFKGMKLALDMLVNDIGVKPPEFPLSGTWVNSIDDQLALRKRSSCPAVYASLWNGPYLQNYANSRTSKLILPSSGGDHGIAYISSWGVQPGTPWGDFCGTNSGMVLYNLLISTQAKRDVENVLIGRIDPEADSWLFYCGFHSDQQVSSW